MIVTFLLSLLMMLGLFLLLLGGVGFVQNYSFLLCNAGFNFFTSFYPECKPVLGHYLFGYNWKTLDDAGYTMLSMKEK